MSRGRALGPGLLQKEKEKWVLRWTDVEGRRRRKVMGTDKRVAERRRQEIIRQRDMALDGLGAVEGMTLSLEEVLRDYLAELHLRVTPRHFKNVSGRIKRLLPDMEGLRVRDLRPMHVVRLRSQAVAGGSSHRTANLIGDSLGAAMKWAVETGIIASNPLAGLRRLPETADHQRYRRRAMTEAEIERFLAASEGDDRENEFRAGMEGWTRVPVTPLWRALLETGARWNELRQVRWGDVDLSKGVLVLRAESTKSRKVRAIPLREEMVGALKRFRALHETVLGRLSTMHDFVFVTPEGCPWPRPTTNPMRILDRVLERAGIPKVNVEGRKLDIHALRHTFQSRLARSNVPLLQAQRLMGHSDPKLTAQVYTHLDVEDLRAAVEAIPRASEREDRSVKEAR